MTDKNNIKKASEYTSKWLATRQEKHIKMVEKSILSLQNNIINMVQKISVDSTGKIEGLKVNMKQAQKIHAKINKAFYTDFSTSTKKIIDDFKSVETLIKKSYKYLDEAIEFTSIDKKTMDVLKNGYWENYISVGNQQRNKIIQSMYSQVISGGRFSDLVNIINGALMGSQATDVLGRSLAQYSRLYARDMIMNFHNEVNLSKSEEIGIKDFMYVGDVIATTRPFCKTRVGKTYTKNQIESWNYKWAGKSGPALTNRGGYNCRHHWQGVRPEWMEKK